MIRAGQTITKVVRVVALAAAVAVVAGCVAKDRFHGYVPEPEALAAVSIGSDTRESVTATLGRPSSAGIESGNSFYYVSSTFRHYGYVAINGCSLTVGEVSKESFMIHLIPETLSITNLFQLQKNSIVNVELDQNTIVIADTVKKYLDGKS